MLLGGVKHEKKRPINVESRKDRHGSSSCFGGEHARTLGVMR